LPALCQDALAAVSKEERAVAKATCYSILYGSHSSVRVPACVRRVCVAVPLWCRQARAGIPTCIGHPSNRLPVWCSWWSFPHLAHCARLGAVSSPLQTREDVCAPTITHPSHHCQHASDAALPCHASSAPHMRLTLPPIGSTSTLW
jgi:hypothetical protein